MLWVSIICGCISAASWLASAAVTPNLSASFFGSPPKAFKLRAQAGAALNGVGAFFAALSIGAQAWVNWQAMP